MSVLDSRGTLKTLYQPPVREFVVVDVPKLRYISIDGEGDPANEHFANMTRWLFTIVHPLRVYGRQVMGKDFVEPPLECLWWADDMQDFIAGKRDRFKWRLMIVADADWISRKLFNDGVKQASEKLGDVPPTLRLASFTEKKCVQIMHVGPPGSQAATAERLHQVYLPQHNLVPSGHYHEIYLSDVRRVAPEKHKTVIRQPVRQV